MSFSFRTMIMFLRRHFKKCCVIVFLLACIAGFYITLTTLNFQDDFYQSLKGNDVKAVCETDACKRVAQRILDYMDPKIKPCDNFYRFACGTFLDTAEIRADKTQNSSFTQVDEKVDDQLKHVVLDSSDDSKGPLPYRTMNKMYSLCMDEKKMDKLGVSHAVSLLQASGGWPVLGNWTDKDWSFLETEIRLRNSLYIGGGSLFQLGISIDSKNASRRVIEVDQAALGLPREFLIKGEDDSIVKAYYRYMVDLAVMYGADIQMAEDQLKQSLLFEIELAKISVPREERRVFDRMYNPYTLKQLMTDMGWINWRKLLERIVPKSVSVSDDELIIVNEVGFLKRLEKFLQKYPNEVIANHMMWHAASDIADLLTSNMRDRLLEFSKVVVGKTAREPRWKECVGVAASLTIALSSAYVKKFFNESSKKAALDMTERIRQEMSRDILELNWMDIKTREQAEYKVSKIVQHIGYPDELTNVTNIENFYDGLKVNEENYFKAVLDLRQWYRNYTYGLLHKPVNKTDWRTHSDVAIVNACYNPLENSMQFPAGILQQPFFSFDVPKYVNYAAIGFIVGHEITHGFDDEGSQFNSEGDLKEWWDEESKNNFKEKKKCIIEQYSNFNDSQTYLMVNGINTQGENVADSAGLKLSYRAYRRLASQLASPEPHLPGLHQYTQDQLFMLSMANTWCTRYRPEALKYQITAGVHSPAEFRVNGALMNLPEFSQIFQCSHDDPMNPANKCTIW